MRRHRVAQQPPTAILYKGSVRIEMIISANRPYFAPYPGFFYKAHLSDYLVILGFLRIETRIVLMSELGISGKGTPLIIDMCKSLGATQFLVQTSALAYYDPPQFQSAGLELVSFKKPEYIYPQMWGDYIANLSILDMMFNCGAKSRDIVLV